MENFMNVGMDAFNDAIANGMDPGAAAQAAGNAASTAASIAFSLAFRILDNAIDHVSSSLILINLSCTLVCAPEISISTSPARIRTLAPSSIYSTFLVFIVPFNLCNISSKLISVSNSGKPNAVLKTCLDK